MVFNRKGAVRAKTKQVKCAPFIESLQTLGVPNGVLCWKYIFCPMYQMSYGQNIFYLLGQCMLTEASVSFMGLGDTTHVIGEA